MWHYPTIYRDKFGEETTTIDNDGRELRMIVRGVEFRGTDFDGLQPTGTQDISEPTCFTLQNGDLCSCVIDCQIPVQISEAQTTEGILEVHLELGDPEPTGGIDREYLLLKLRLGQRCHVSSGGSGWFEDELLDMQKQLPEGVFIKTCINCAFSDYSPLGHGLFGNLACFRDNKEGYRSVRTKADIFRVWKTMTEYVQETYICPEFEKRQPDTGYRG